MNLEAIRQANPLPQIAARLVRLRQSGREWTACCPFHDDHSPSFTIFDEGQRFHCFGCGASGDVLDFVQRIAGVGLTEAARMLGMGEVPAVQSPRFMERLEPASDDRNVNRARSIWQAALPAAGTVAEAYLRWRGINPPYPPSLRFLALPWGNLPPVPCLVCAVQDVSGEVTGIQRIWLAPDGHSKAAVDKPKLSLGRVKGGAIRLGEPDDRGCLTVCEGPEDGLSLRVMLGGPVWVAAGASFLPGMQFPPAVRAVIVAADNDSAGRKAADKAARAFALRGLEARIIRPLDGCKDFNDELREVGHGC